MTSLTNSNLELKNMFGQFMKMNTASSSGSKTLPSNTITNPKEDLKGITTRSGTAYQGPTIPTTPYSLPKVVERETEVTYDTVPPTNNRSTKDVQPSVFQIETPVLNSEPVVAPFAELYNFSFYFWCMSTRSSARNLFLPLDNPKHTIQRRSRADPTILNDFEMAAEGNGDPPVPDLQTMEELCQPSLNGRGGPIAPIVIQATNFELKNDMIQQMAKMFLEKYFPPSMVTKLRNEITNFRQRPDESLFEARERYKLSIDRCPNHNMFPVTQIDTFYNGLTLRHCDIINAVAGGTFMKRRPEECYDLIENMTAHHNDWDTSAQRMIFQPPLAKPRMYMLWEPTKVVILTNRKEDLKGITTRSGTAYQGPTIPTTTSSSLPKVVEREIETTKDPVHPTNNGSTKDVQPLVVQAEIPIQNYKPIVAPIIEPVVAPVSAPKPNQKPSIPYPSRLHDQKLRDKAND
nr:reverse transcriptase domain-containing protein [Tanacetum cinerariifolium]